MGKKKEERAEYSAIVDRKPVKLPGGARLGVWFIINVERWDINATMARAVLPTPQGVTVIPDIPNYSWFQYGLRVGFWRLKKVLDKHGVRATVSLNAPVKRMSGMSSGEPFRRSAISRGRHREDGWVQV